MKKLFGLTVLVLFSVSFGRVASYNTIIVSPVESFIQKKQLEVSAAQNGSDDSVQWKRRHKRRKKLRRPQRGR
jgi:hypothetical protein